MLTHIASPVILAHSKIVHKGFWSRVNTSGPTAEHCLELGQCWLWTGHTRNGYGSLRQKGRNASAHRVCWELLNGPIPAGLQILHRCDNRACVRPEHLWLGTHDDNMKDKAKKGRGHAMPGEENPNCKLTNEQAKEIRRIYAAGNISQRKLAAQFLVTQKAVCRIVNGIRR